MANRAFFDFQSMLGRGMALWVRIKWVSGLPVLQAFNTKTGLWQAANVSPFSTDGGWLTTASVVRQSAGDLLITLTDSYVALMGFAFNWENATGLPSTPGVGLKASNVGAVGGGTLEVVTSVSPGSSITGATAAITGATGTTTGAVTTLSGGTSAVATGYAINALKGMIVSDGTTTAVVLSNTAIVASGGTISGGTITTSVPLAATITATLAVTQQTITQTAGVATDPTDGDILNLTLFMCDTDTI